MTSPANDNKLAFIVDNKVEKILSLDSEFAQIVLNKGTIVNITGMPENSVAIGSLYDASNNTFIFVEDVNAIIEEE